MSGGKRRSTLRTNVPNKSSIYARDELIRKAINPIDMLLEVYMEAMTSYKKAIAPKMKTDESGELVEDKNARPDFSATSYLSIAGSTASKLMEYYSPKLTAIALKVDPNDERAPMGALDAAEIINSDPFANHARKIAEAATLEAKTVAPPILAKGSSNE